MSNSRWSMMLGILPLVSALGGLSGCYQQSTADEETGVASPRLEEAEAPKGARGDRMRGGKHGPGMGMGPGFLLGAALSELDLSDAQRATIEGELDALHEVMGPRHERGDFAAHRAALAAAVRSGKIDEAALGAPPAPSQRDHGRMVKAMAVLHDTLTADQRQALVSRVRAQHDERGFDEGRPGKGRFGGERGARGEMGSLGHALHGIELTDAQRAAVREALAKQGEGEVDREVMKARREAHRKVMEERLTSFAAEKFDASAFAAPPKDAPMRGFGHGREGMIKKLAIVVPLLDDAQRAELAKRIEQGPPEGKHHGRRGPR